MIKKYACEKCGKVFDTEEKCIQCESSHIEKIERYSVNYNKIFSPTNDDRLNIIKAESQGVPTHVLIKWEDFDNHTYHYVLNGVGL